MTNIPEGDPSCDRYLSTYYAQPDVERTQSAANGYEVAPTLVSMSDVFINTYGYVWNAKVRQIHYRSPPLPPPSRTAAVWYREQCDPLIEGSRTVDLVRSVLLLIVPFHSRTKRF